MSDEVLEFLIRARECPLGRKLWLANNADEVKQLMEDEGVKLADKELIIKANNVFDAKEDFKQNADFRLPPGTHY